MNDLTNKIVKLTDERNYLRNILEEFEEADEQEDLESIILNRINKIQDKIDELEDTQSVQVFYNYREMLDAGFEDYLI